MPKSELPEREMIINEWDRWVDDNVLEGQKADGLKALAFFEHLASARPKLLDFSFAGDKWPIVKIWLRQAGRIPE
jgi:hypothetical protein